MTFSLITFLFATVCDSTGPEHDDESSARLAVGFEQMVRELAYYESCEVIRATRDAVLVRASRVEQAYRLAEEIKLGAAQRGYPPIRMGIDRGPAAAAAGAWHGSAVRMAACVAETADPGELRMTERARAKLGSVSRLDIVEHDVHAKGLPDSLLHGASALASGVA